MSGCVAFSNSSSVGVVQKWIGERNGVKPQLYFFRAKNFKCACDCPLLYCLYPLRITVYNIHFLWVELMKQFGMLKSESRMFPYLHCCGHGPHFIRLSGVNALQAESKKVSLHHAHRHLYIYTDTHWYKAWGSGRGGSGRERRRPRIKSVSTSDSHILLQQLKSEFHRVEIRLFTVVSIRFIKFDLFLIHFHAFNVTAVRLQGEKPSGTELTLTQPPIRAKFDKRIH